MMKIVLSQGAYAERLAEYLSELLGERFRFPSDHSPPFAKQGGRVWQLDQAEMYWLIHEQASAYRFEGRTESARHTVRGLIGQVRTYPLVTSAKLVE